jgi:hypothetical protein
MDAAVTGNGRWLVKEGMNAALLEDLAALAPYAARVWVMAMLDPEKPRVTNLQVPIDLCVLDEQTGKMKMSVVVPRAMVLDLLGLPGEGDS